MTWILTLTANLIITIAMIASLIHLVTGIPQHLEAPKALLRSASALWIANILVFASCARGSSSVTITLATSQRTARTLPLFVSWKRR